MQDGTPSNEDLYREWPKLWVETTEDCCVFALSTSGIVLTWNPAGERIHGYRSEEILGEPLSRFYCDRDKALGLPDAALREATRCGRSVSEGWQVRKDGTSFWASTVLTLLQDEGGLHVGFGMFVKDETEKRAAHEAVLASERSFRLLVQGVKDYAIFMLTPDGRVASWNSGARRIKGYAESEIVGSHFSRFYTPEDLENGVPHRGLETARREGRFEAEGWRVRQDGSRFWAHVVIDAIHDGDQLVGFAKITRDITERRRAAELLAETQRALYQAQKMEALGKLTGGVAHDFNNVLQVLRGNLELLQSRHGGDTWSGERLGKAIDAVDRGAKLASQLLAFGRQQPLDPVIINPAKQLRALDDMLRRALGEAIEIECVVAGGLWNTIVDPNQLENVILNLAINARDAMPGGGKLTLELANATLDDEYVSTVPELEAGQYVVLAVSDTGSGMSAEVMEKAFDPFFSTKAEGQGTGLGLSMAYGFAKQSGGHIKLYSEIGHGTTVRLYLPRSMGAAVEPTSRQNPILQRGSETVLVVEDDQEVQSTVVEMLTALGYAVLKADDAEKALAVISSGVHIDLLFTDVVMPGRLRSPEMAKRATQMLPGLKVLFTSGYTQNAIVHGGRLDSGVHLLSKPYTREQLSAKVRQVLGNGARIANTAAPAESSNAGRKTRTEALCVLAVDDDPASLEALCELLLLEGVKVLRARSGEAALDVLRTGAIDVLMTDVVMPDMTGIDVARSALSLHPNLKVVLVSGNRWTSEDAAVQGATTLSKPYSIAQLREALQSVGANFPPSPSDSTVKVQKNE
ncbi:MULTISPECIES: hybrid sensor histidine kinase/response regulator [unclassified Cupriavidus]|uniref:hybrid sensor histidine kinase/response regulator n=1 Tax=unclassified Cupriavidus TaxID=2640874 RepID=UPI00313C4A8A